MILNIINQFSSILMPIFYKVLYLTIIGSIVGIIVFLVRTLFDKKISEKWKCILWFIVLASLIIPIRFELKVENQVMENEIISKAENIKNMPYEELYSKNILEFENNQITESEEVIESQELSQNEDIETHKKSIPIKYIMNLSLPYIWILGILIYLISLVQTTREINRKISKQIYKDERIENILQEVKSWLNINKKIKIVLQEYKKIPSIYGMFEPVILISESILKEDDETIKYIFMHELSHYKRKDMVTNTILLIMTAIHWFNPLVYRFFKKIRQEMELATDEITLSKMDKLEKKQYGLTLIQLLQTYETSKTATKMLCITDDNKNMERRIEKIKWSTKLKKYRISIILLIILIIFCIMSPFVVKLDATTISEEDEKLYNIVEQYLIKTEEKNHSIEMNEFAQNGDDFKVFIDMAKLGVRKNQDETYVYVWALIQSCHAQEELVTSGSSMGYKFIIKDNEVIDYQITEDGEMYEKSIEEIFPEDIRKKIEKANELEVDLVDSGKIEKQIEEHYSYLNYINTNDIQNVNTNYVDTQNVFVGKWSPYKAEQNGEEIPLSVVYGSGIAYGGELILNSDETYTEFIGVYSEDALNDLQGKYRRYGNGEKAILTTNNKETKILEMLESSKDNSNVNSDEATIVLMTEGGIHVYFKRVD